MGLMLLTDAMINEHVRSCGRQGAALIAIPRAACTATDNWLAAGTMAAIVFGSYVVSSNQVGTSSEGVTYGGTGFAFHPNRSLLAVTDAATPLVTAEINPAVADHHKSLYPRYVV